MAFDAGMLACVLKEIKDTAAGARIEKVYQPEKDTIVLQMRTFGGGKRLLINAGSNNARIGFSEHPMENPPTPPIFCVLLRKHLSGAKLSSVRQMGFERVACLEFECHDEMGFLAVRRIYAEIMGKYSNLVFTDGEDKILAVLRPVDFTTSSRRQVLVGMTYELPPAQEGKTDPLLETMEGFYEKLSEVIPDTSADKHLLRSYLGISQAVAREIVYLATRHTDTAVRYCSRDVLWGAFSEVADRIRSGAFVPTIVFLGDSPVEYAFLPLTQYGGDAELRAFDSAGEMLDRWFGSRDNAQRVKQRASDILKLLTGAEARIRKKLELQREELLLCERGEFYKKCGDLITANIYLLKRGQTEALLTDYEDYREDGTFGECHVTLDARLDPAQNAQAYYKKYTKSRKAKVELEKQILLGEAELRYIDTVFDALTHAETPTDLAEIRDELYRSGYASRMKGYSHPKKNAAPTVMQFRTTNGYKVLCGKNNVQNEYITHKLAGKTDYWFHVKNRPGSHAVMFCEGEEPEAQDFTDAAEIAAFYAKAEGEQKVEVDYTYARNVKKPPASHPGFVIYHTNWSCIVTPNADRVAAMRVK